MCVCMYVTTSLFSESAGSGVEPASVCGGRGELRSQPCPQCESRGLRLGEVRLHRVAEPVLRGQGRSRPPVPLPGGGGGPAEVWAGWEDTADAECLCLCDIHLLQPTCSPQGSRRGIDYLTDHTYLSSYVCMYCMYVCIYVCMYICMYVYSNYLSIGPSLHLLYIHVAYVYLPTYIHTYLST